MVISFEEKDREKIETTGMTIIQVKQNMYKFSAFIKNVCQTLKKYYNSLSTEQKAELLKSIENGE